MKIDPLLILLFFVIAMNLIVVTKALVKKSVHGLHDATIANLVLALVFGLVLPLAAQERTSALKDFSNVDPATAKSALGFLEPSDIATDDVIVTYADGSKQSFAPSADTDAGRTDALEAAWASMKATAGAERITLFPANFYLNTAPTTISGLPVQFEIDSGMIIELNGARLYHTATEQSYIMFAASCGTGNLAHDWSFTGPGVLEGMTPSPTGTFTTGDTSSGEVGIHVAGGGGYSYRYLIQGVTARYFKNAAILCNSASYPSWKFTSGRIVNCVLDTNIIGLAGYAGHEFVTITNTTANYCKRGFSVDVGNWNFVNCQAGACTGDGLYIHSSGNHAHGNWVGGQIVHNYNYAIRVAPGVIHGWTFEGAHIGGSDGVTPNKVQLDGYGININGGQLDSPIYTTAVNSGFNCLSNVYISNAATATLTNLFPGSRKKFKIRGCFTSSGNWSSNDSNAGSYFVKDYGAVSDGVSLYDATYTSGDATLTSASANFTAQDVGKSIVLQLSQTSRQITTIASRTSATEIELTVAPTASSSAYTPRITTYGTDNTAAIQATINAAQPNGGGSIIFESGIYLCVGAPTDIWNRNSIFQIPRAVDPRASSPLAYEFVGPTPPQTYFADSNQLPNTGGNTVIYCPNQTTHSKSFTVVSANTFTSVAHGFSSGDAIKLAGGTSLPSGLYTGVTYHVHVLTADTFRLTLQYSDAIAGTSLLTFPTVGGSHTLTDSDRSIFAIVRGGTQQPSLGMGGTTYWGAIAQTTAFRNIAIRQYPVPNMHALQFRYGGRLLVDDVACDVDTPYSSSTNLLADPAPGGAIGIVCPERLSGYGSNIGRAYVYGYDLGIEIGDLTAIQHITLEMCRTGGRGRSTTNYMHANVFNAYRCRQALQGPLRIVIDQLNVETNRGGEAWIPAWTVQLAGQYAVDNYDGGITGKIVAGDVLAGTGRIPITVRNPPNSPALLEVHDAVWNANIGNSSHGNVNVAKFLRPLPPNLRAFGVQGSTTYKYHVLYEFNGGRNWLSDEATTTLGNATLDGSNYIRVFIQPYFGAHSWTGYKVYRTSSGGTPATVGLIASGVASSGGVVVNDTGLSAGGETAAEALGTTPTVAVAAGAESTTYKYRVGYVMPSGATVLSPEVAVTNGNDVLTSTDKVNVTINPLHGAASFHLYRTYNGANPTNVGRLLSGVGGFIPASGVATADTGQTADGILPEETAGLVTAARAELLSPATDKETSVLNRQENDVRYKPVYFYQLASNITNGAGATSNDTGSITLPVGYYLVRGNLWMMRNVTTSNCVGSLTKTSGGTVLARLMNEANHSSTYDDRPFSRSTAGYIMNADGTTVLGGSLGMDTIASASKTALLSFNGWLKVTGSPAVIKFQVSQGTQSSPFTVGQTYTIVTAGDTDFTLIGAANNTPGTVFTATGAGTGSGTVGNTGNPATLKAESTYAEFTKVK